MFNDKTLDITLDEGASLAYSLALESELEVCTAHPITGENTNCHIQATPTDISAATFTGSIVAEFGGSVLATFTTALVGDGSTGVVRVSLSKTTIETLADLVRDNPPIQKNPRLRDLGFYNINYITAGSQVRIMEGRVTISLGA